MHKEKFETVQNGVHTVLEVEFDEKGYPKAINVNSFDEDYIPSPEEELENQRLLLEKQIEDYLAEDTAEGYLKAGELRKQLDELLQKPTK